jgi:hypothetical protein
MDVAPVHAPGVAAMPTLLEPHGLPSVDEHDEFAAYGGRCRRIAVGPAVTLIFENRETLRFRLNELRSFARSAPSQSNAALNWYSRLLPGENAIRATVLVRRPGRRPTAELQNLACAIRDGEIAIVLGGEKILGRVTPLRGGDRVLGPSFWVEFHFDAEARAKLADFSVECELETHSEDYSESAMLSLETRLSLLDDLEG